MAGVDERFSLTQEERPAHRRLKEQKQKSERGTAKGLIQPLHISDQQSARLKLQFQYGTSDVDEVCSEEIEYDITAANSS